MVIEKRSNESTFSFRVRWSFDILKRAVTSWNADKVPRLAAALSFYAILALSPMLILMVSILGSILSEKDLNDHILAQVRNSMGADASKFIAELISNASRPGASIAFAIVSLIIALFGASNLIVQLEESINTIWERETPKLTIFEQIKARLVNSFFTLFICILIGIWLISDIWIGIIAHQAGGGDFTQTFSYLFGTFFFFILCALAYKEFPSGRLAWRDIFPGACFAAVAIRIFQVVLSVYFARSSITSAYGPSGAIVILLLWIYYTSQIFFLGAEITYVYAHQYGSQRKIEPLKDVILQNC